MTVAADRFIALGHETSRADLDALDGLARMAANQWCLDVGYRSEGAPPSEAIEVGSWAGRTALALCPYFDVVYCVDTWRGSPGDRLGDVARMAERHLGPDPIFRAFCKNMGERLYTEVVPCRGTSLDYAAVWPRKVALVFLDADHSYDAIRADILAWREHIIPGGVLCGHDFGPQFPGVVQAVRELIPPDDLSVAGEAIWWAHVR